MTKALTNVKRKKHTVTRRNDLVSALGHWTVWERRLYLNLLSKVKFQADSFELTRIYYAEMMDMYHLSGNSNYEQIRNAASELQEKKLFIPYVSKVDGTRMIAKVPLLGFLGEIDEGFTKGAEMIIEGKGFVECVLNPLLKPHVLNLKNSFTVIDIYYASQLKSSYGFALYDIFKQNAYREEEFKMSCDLIKERLGICSLKLHQDGTYEVEDDSIPLIANFKSLLKRNIKAINKRTDLSVKVRFTKVKREHFAHFTVLTIIRGLYSELDWSKWKTLPDQDIVNDPTVKNHVLTAYVNVVKNLPKYDDPAAEFIRLLNEYKKQLSIGFVDEEQRAVELFNFLESKTVKGFFFLQHVNFLLKEKVPVEYIIEAVVATYKRAMDAKRKGTPPIDNVFAYVKSLIQAQKDGTYLKVGSNDHKIVDKEPALSAERMIELRATYKEIITRLWVGRIRFYKGLLTPEFLNSNGFDAISDLDLKQTARLKAAARSENELHYELEFAEDESKIKTLKEYDVDYRSVETEVFNAIQKDDQFLIH